MLQLINYIQYDENDQQLLKYKQLILVLIRKKLKRRKIDLFESIR